MAETQRIATYGEKPPCASHARLRLRLAKRLEAIQERNRKNDKPEDFVIYDSSEDEEESFEGNNQYLRNSFNFADYVRSRECDTREVRKFDRQFGHRHLLSYDLLREFPVKVDNMNKIFCSQWLSNRQIAFGTKCNKLMVYDVATRKSLQIPSLHGRQNARVNAQQPFGIYSIQINPSRTLLATVARNNREIAIYRLPTLDPVCVGEGGHHDWIYDMCWVDDEYLVSGSKDSRMALWQIDQRLFEAATKELTHRLIRPVVVKKCDGAEAVRALGFNRSKKEIAVYSTNSFIHIWSAETFKQRVTKKLPARHDNPCLAVHGDGSLYAVGCQSYTLLLDWRMLNPVRKIPSRYSGSGVKSASFQNSVLTIGTGVGMVMFYDLKAQKYLESSINSNRTVMLKTSRGYVFPDEGYVDGVQNVKYTPAIYTHCYDASGTRLFCAGGPLIQNLMGNYAGLWQ